MKITEDTTIGQILAIGQFAASLTPEQKERLLQPLSDQQEEAFREALRGARVAGEKKS